MKSLRNQVWAVATRADNNGRVLVDEDLAYHMQSLCILPEKELSEECVKNYVTVHAHNRVDNGGVSGVNIHVIDRVYDYSHEISVIEMCRTIDIALEIINE